MLICFAKFNAVDKIKYGTNVNLGLPEFNRALAQQSTKSRFILLAAQGRSL